MDPDELRRQLESLHEELRRLQLECPDNELRRRLESLHEELRRLQLECPDNEQRRQWESLHQEKLQQFEELRRLQVESLHEEISGEWESFRFLLADGPFHVGSILEQCDIQLPRRKPVEVTILDNLQGWSADRFFRSELAKQLAKHSKVKVTRVVPRYFYSETEKREAQRDGIRIVEVGEKPGYINPTDWLMFPPKHFSTDIVVGVGEEMGKIAHIWKEHLQCKSVFLARGDQFTEKFIQRDISSEAINSAFCSKADLPIAIGSKMSDNLTASLKYHNKRVFDLTPGIISELRDINQSAEDGGKFRVLITGGNDPNTFHAEGLDIAAMAVAELKDKSYHLIYVGAGEETKEKFVAKFHQFGIAKSQLTIRSHPKNKEEWKRLLCEVDLAIMPSCEKEFGSEALLALSAGLPILVHSDTGFGEALRKVKFGNSAIVDSEEAAAWAGRIKRVRETMRKQRLEEASKLRSNYDETYSWEKQCGNLVAMMVMMTSELKVSEV